MPITEEQSATLQKLVRFYFSDSNIMQDKFLLSQVKENEGGFVPLSTLCTFNKVKAITSDADELANAVQGAEGLELSEDRKSVKRLAPLPEKWDPVPRSIYAKADPIEKATHEELTEFFAQYGEVSRVTKRPVNKKNPDGSRAWKPSCYVEFATEEQAKKALEAAPVFKDVKLEVMTREAHEKELVVKREQFGQTKRPADKKPADQTAEPQVGEKRKREDDDAPVELPANASLKFTETGDLDDWKIVKAAILAIAPVRFCVIQNSTAIIMLNSKEDVEKVVQKNAEEPITFGDVKPVACVALEGEEEAAFRKQMTEKITELKHQQKKPKGGKGGKKGGKKGGRKGGKGGKH